MLKLNNSHSFIQVEDVESNPGLKASPTTLAGETVLRVVSVSSRTGFGDLRETILLLRELVEEMVGEEG